MNEGIEDVEVSEESYERMNNLVIQNDYKNFIDSATNIMNDLTKDGFEAKEVFYYLYTRLTADI
jgi:deoxyhypusine synthase